jgi:hypothetical protein
MHDMVTQHILTRRCSIAVLGLGLGIKGCRRSVGSAVFFFIIIVSETVEAVAVGRRWFV